MIGKKILHYKIIEKLGEGGMGIVYKALDTKLNREVAIKILPPHLLVSEDDRARFHREAKAAAALNHAHIATVYEINETEEQPFIVMEFVEGATLDQTIVQGPLKLEDAISITIQIADGLQAAHKKDVVHRDIKASNILLGSDKQAKILDFGLAKTSMSTKLTQMGTTIGTVAYMSPEQVQGKEVDHRTDLWSLGVLLYEMLAGHLPFKAEYDQAIFYSIQNENPEPLTAIRTGVPMSLEWIVSKLMAKSPAERYQSAHDLIIDLKAVNLNDSGFSRITQTGRALSAKEQSLNPTPKSKSLSWISAALFFISSLILAGLLINEELGEQATVDYFNISIAYSRPRTDVNVVAISPDGRNIIFSMNDNGVTQLYIRSLDDFTSTKIIGTENGSHPVFSPDGQRVAFSADGKLKISSIKGGAVNVIADCPGFRGASWSSDNTIIFSPRYASGLYSVKVTGGELTAVSGLDTLNNERTHRWPQVLPDGKHILYTIGYVEQPNSYNEAQLVIQSLENGERHLIDFKGEMARYLDGGQLVIARKGMLLGASFSLADHKILSPPVSLVSDVDGDAGSGISYFDISGKGDLVYIQGKRNQELEMVWIDLEGHVEVLPVGKKPFNIPRVSPDGKTIAVTVNQGSSVDGDIWLYDIASTAFRRFTFGQYNINPVWSYDGSAIYYSASQVNASGVFYKSLAGNASENKLNMKYLDVYYPVSSSSDGRYLVMNRAGGTSEGDLGIYDLLNKKEEQLTFTREFEHSGIISDDGRYITYGSNETGRTEVYIKTFPDMKGKWQVSTEGGSNPVWAPDGKKIYFLNNVGQMMAVSIQKTPVFSTGNPRVQFDVSQMYFPNNPLSNFDITPDGKKFLMIRSSSYQNNVTSFNYIKNWALHIENTIQ